MGRQAAKNLEDARTLQRIKENTLLRDFAKNAGVPDIVRELRPTIDGHSDKIDEDIDPQGVTFTIRGKKQIGRSVEMHWENTDQYEPGIDFQSGHYRQRAVYSPGKKQEFEDSASVRIQYSDWSKPGEPPIASVAVSVVKHVPAGEDTLLKRGTLCPKVVRGDGEFNLDSAEQAKKDVARVAAKLILDNDLFGSQQKR